MMHGGSIAPMPPAGKCSHGPEFRSSDSFFRTSDSGQLLVNSEFKTRVWVQLTRPDIVALGVGQQTKCASGHKTGLRTARTAFLGLLFSMKVESAGQEFARFLDREGEETLA